MKKLTLSLLAACAVASPAIAGTTVVTKEVAPVVIPPACFKDQEVQLDIFYSYNDGNPRTHQYYRDGSGGGVAVNYFFARYFGISVEGNWWNGATASDVFNNDRSRSVSSGKLKSSRSVAHQVTGNLVLRYPFETCGVCFAPYIFGGGGVITNGQTGGFGDVGAGLEYRITENIGIFGDWRWNFVGNKNKNDVSTTRGGLRFVF